MTNVFLDVMRGAAAASPDETARTPPAAPAAVAAPASAAPMLRPARDPWQNRWRRLRTLIQREVRATLRDRWTVTMLIAVPLGALLTFGSIVSTEVNDLPLAVHDAGDSPASRRLLSELRATGAFTARRYATREALEQALVSGSTNVAIIIPPDFERALARRTSGGEPPEIQALYDGTETVLAGNAEAFLRAIVARAGARLRFVDTSTHAPGGASAIRVVMHGLFNPEFDGVPFMVAGTYGFVLTFLTTLITAVAIVNERVTGTFEQLQVTPATSAEIVLGKILPLGAVFAADVTLMLLMGGVFLGVWPHGSTLFFIAISSFYVLVSLALGLIISATSATAAEAVQKTVLFSIPLIFLGGFLFPIRNLPLAFRWLSELFPATHYIRISRAIYLRGEGPLTLATEIGMVALIGIVLMTIAFRTVEARS
jgi:ABC-2 type transport system permease protein